MAIGTLFHFVALAEVVLSTGQLSPVSVYHSESLLAFFLMLFFFGVYWRYKTPSPGIIVFPVVFLLTLMAALGQDPPKFTSPVFRSGWIFLHIALIFCGYAALLFSFISSIFYLLQERRLKAKDVAGSRFLSRLPALAVMDDIGLRSLIIGFLAGYVLGHTGGRTAKTILGTGFCGALTTWSTASWESVRLAEEGAMTTAITFTLVNLVASFAAAAVGIALLGS